MIGHYVAAIVLPTARVLTRIGSEWTHREADLDEMFLPESEK